MIKKIITENRKGVMRYGCSGKAGNIGGRKQLSGH